MDLALYGRVLWRFRVIVALGTACALLAAIIAVAHVDFTRSGGLTFRYRSNELWSSQSTLLVTQHGFPWGQLTLPQSTNPTQTQQTQPQQNFADPSRLVFLASLYAQFAKADAIKAIVHPRAEEKVLASPVDDTSSGSSVGSPLPLVSVAGIATSSARALQLASLATSAFMYYIDRQQSAAGIRSGNRVVLQVVSRPSVPVVFQKRRMTPAILAFILVLTATLVLVFSLENLRKSRSVAVVEPLRAEGDSRSEGADESAPARAERAAASPSEHRQHPIARL
jgi:hypothetical protein